MKNKKMIFLISAIILFVLIGALIVYRNRDRRTYELNLPETENLINIILQQKEQVSFVRDFEKKQDIIDILKGVKRITHEESIQDMPTNVENEIKLDFISENEMLTIFVYKKEGKYYIEQPYNGIYRISADEYNSIENYVVK